MKMTWLVTNVTPIRSPNRAECDILGMVLDLIWSIQATFVVGEPLCDVGGPLEP